MSAKTEIKLIERTYNRIPEVAHCPLCHRRVGLPAFVKTANIKGVVKVTCGCKRGAVVITRGVQADG